MQVWWCHQLLSMEPWAATKNALCKCGGATSSFTWVAAKKALCKCGGATSCCPWSHVLGPKNASCNCGVATSSCLHGAMGWGQKKLYASVVVPPAPVHGAMGWGQKSFMQVWWCHQMLSMEPWAEAKKTLCKCGGATSSCPWSHGLRPKRLYASVVVPPAAVHGAMGWGQKKLYATVVVPPTPVHEAMGWDQNSFMQVWWYHQLLSMDPWAGAKKGLWKCGGATSSCPCSHGLRPKKLYASVVVPPNPVRGAMGWGQNSFMQV